MSKSPTPVFPELTNEVIYRMKGASNARLKHVMTLLVQHVHAFVREAELTQDEWFAAIEFLTRTGQMCSDTRQEFILLSDILGVSMLVDAVNHRAGPGVTESTVLGPFYTGTQREIRPGESILLHEEDGETLLLTGRVLDAGGEPIANATIEVWQASTNQLYDVQDAKQEPGHLRGTLHSAADGRYEFLTVVPPGYPIPSDGPAGALLEKLGRHPYRPAHVHFMISAPGFRTLVTHLFIDGDKYLASDAVFGVKPQLIAKPTPIDGLLTIQYDFGLARAHE